MRHLLTAAASALLLTAHPGYSQGTGHDHAHDHDHGHDHAPVQDDAI